MTPVDREIIGSLIGFALIVHNHRINSHTRQLIEEHQRAAVAATAYLESDSGVPVGDGTTYTQFGNHWKQMDALMADLAERRIVEGDRR